MIDSIDDLVRVLELQSQEDIAGVMDVDSLKISNVFSYKVMRPELDDSCIKLIEFMQEKLGLSFAGVYVNTDLDTGAQLDRRSGTVVPAHWSDVDPEYKSLPSMHLSNGDYGSRIVHKLRSGDHDPFGLVVFEKQEFSLQDAALIKDAVRKFSAHIENIREKYPLREQVITDDLTGIFNKRKLKRDYLTAVRNWQHQGLDFGLAFGDLDHFKEVNTFYGHDYGDYVLATVAEIMTSALGGRGTLYRFGGEEFVIICPGASPERMERAARDITNKIREYAFVDGENGRKAREITMSMGVVSTLESNLQDRRIINVAMSRLMKAKGYDNRDRIVSNVDLDIETGIASMPLFIPHLKDRIRECNSRAGKGQYGAVAVMNFDIVHFSYWIHELKDGAFDILKKLVGWWKSQTDSFGYVARDNNRDGIITSLYTPDADDCFREVVVSKAYEYLGKLRELHISTDDFRRIEFDFAVGAVIYDPRKVDQDTTYIPKPRFLTWAAEKMVNHAADLPERVHVGYYDGNIPAQLLPAKDVAESACKELEAALTP